MTATPYEQARASAALRRVAVATLRALAREQDATLALPVLQARLRGDAARAVRAVWATLREGSSEAMRAAAQVRALEGRAAIPSEDLRGWATGWEAAS